MNDNFAAGASFNHNRAAGTENSRFLAQSSQSLRPLCSGPQPGHEGLTYGPTARRSFGEHGREHA